MNSDFEKIKAEYDEYLQLHQLQDFMTAVSDLLDEKEAELDRLRHENELLFSGIGACVLATGKDELFIPDLILDQKIKVEIFRDPGRPFGFTVKVDKCI